MVVKTVELEKVCGITSDLYKTSLPEFAFAGKSNVGKSSLINGLVQRKSLARTSAEPGKTQTINYYNLNNELYLVDLPGYGYAKAGKETVAKWGKMIENYLNVSPTLTQVFLLLDIRHEASDNDRLMYSWIKNAGFKPIVIATKLDKINRSQIQKNVKMLRQSLCSDSEQIIIPFSAQTKQGRDDIYNVIDSYIGNKKES